MDDTLKRLIKKHAQANNITVEEATKIYNAYQVKINTLVDAMELTDIKEIRVPWLMRFTFNEKKYAKYIENRDKKKAKLEVTESELEGGLDLLGDVTL